jgi:hypothetical protein
MTDWEQKTLECLQRINNILAEMALRQELMHRAMTDVWTTINYNGKTKKGYIRTQEVGDDSGSGFGDAV